jgi:signal peptidase I
VNICKEEETALYNVILGKGAHLRIKVTGGSMEPYLSSDDVVTIKRVHAESLMPGDLVFYTGTNGNQILHRLMKTQKTEGGMLLHTKGDALTTLDEPIHVDRLLGKACRIERKFSAIYIDLESRRRKGIGYSIAVFIRLKCGIKSVILFLLGIWKNKKQKMV